jgi:hypothetical protein
MLSPSPAMMSPSLSAWSSHLSPAAQLQRRMSSGSGLPILSPGGCFGFFVTCGGWGCRYAGMAQVGGRYSMHGAPLASTAHD